MTSTRSKKLLTIVLLLFSITCLFILVTECRAEDKKEEIRRTYYASDKIKTEAHYINGKLDGVSKRYYENGSLWSEANYKDGKRQGATKEYYLNGKIKADLIYEGGKLKSGTLYNMKGKEIMGDMTKTK
jgi:antitoxin component YwqK of YwqJK toxin-antitoxin module